MTAKEIRPIEHPKEYGTKLLYKLVIGKSGRGWLYPLNSDHPADDIYCTNSGDWSKGGEGFGGSTLKFDVVVANPDWNVEPFELHGGWHSNSSALLSDTNVDLTDKHYTRCVIATEDKNTYPKFVLDNILHEENDWVVGQYDRGELLAKGFANKLGVPVYCYKQSTGGGMMGWVHPDTVSPE